jgi:hypothetical protein
VLLIRGTRRCGFEIKWGDAPAVTKSTHVALTDLDLDTLAIIYAGDRRATLGKRMELVPLLQLDEYLTERELAAP